MGREPELKSFGPGLPPNGEFGLAVLLTLGGHWTFVGGKGGTGKTTTAAALAVSLADAGHPVLVLSTDPAHSLGDALGVPLGAEPRPVPRVPGLRAMEVDAETERGRFLAAHRALIAALVERGTYLERGDVDSLLDLPLPGIDELAALLRLMRLGGAEGGLPPRLVIDTAPTGHTLRLLRLPTAVRGWLNALRALEAKHRLVAEALTGISPENAAIRFLDGMEADLNLLASRLRDPAHTRFVLVTTPEPTVVAETLRYLDALRAEGIAPGGVIVNRSQAKPRPGTSSDAQTGTTAQAGESPTEPARTAASTLSAPDSPSAPVHPAHSASASASPAQPLSPEAKVAYVPLFPNEPQGIAELRSFAAAARPHPAAAGEVSARPVGEYLRLGEAYFPPTDRTLYLVGGKGGVGKTTLASALAVELAARAGGPVLLLSTDPAGSLGDLFGAPVGATPIAAPGTPGLTLQQVDAAAAWDAFRAEYRARVQELFAELTGGISAEADRRVVASLVDFAPPGVDEMMALLEVVDVADAALYNALILDTAPTGHLLRLLEMPRVGLDWAHALLRLLLKYRRVLGLGDLAERTLAFSRALRALRTRLEDRTHTLTLVAALPESLSVAETERLLPRLEAFGIGAEVLFVNRLFTPEGDLREARATRAAELLRSSGRQLQGVGAPEWEHGPRGAEDLARFACSWRRVRSAEA